MYNVHLSESDVKICDQIKEEEKGYLPFARVKSGRRIDKSEAKSQSKVQGQNPKFTGLSLLPSSQGIFLINCI